MFKFLTSSLEELELLFLRVVSDFLGLLLRCSEWSNCESIFGSRRDFRGPEWRAGPYSLGFGRGSTTCMGRWCVCAHLGLTFPSSDWIEETCSPPLCQFQNIVEDDSRRQTKCDKDIFEVESCLVCTLLLSTFYLMGISIAIESGPLVLFFGVWWHSRSVTNKFSNVF